MPVGGGQLADVLGAVAHDPGEVARVAQAAHDDAVQVHRLDEVAEQRALQAQHVPPAGTGSQAVPGREGPSLPHPRGWLSAAPPPPARPSPAGLPPAGLPPAVTSPITASLPSAWPWHPIGQAEAGAPVATPDPAEQPGPLTAMHVAGL